MNINNNKIKEIKLQEKELIFKEFNCETALNVGMMMVDKAKEKGHKVTIDISRFKQQLFHYSFEGTCYDNDVWIKRKRNVVMRFNVSSYLLYLLLEQMGKSIKERYRINSCKYAARGGSFPIIIDGTGVIGSITVSGLIHEEDHNFIVEVLKKYFNK